MTKKKTNSNKPEEIRLKVTNWDEAVPTMICRDHGASAARKSASANNFNESPYRGDTRKPSS